MTEVVMEMEFDSELFWLWKTVIGPLETFIKFFFFFFFRNPQQQERKNYKDVNFDFLSKCSCNKSVVSLSC